MAILALLAALVGASRGSLMAPHANARFDIALVVPAEERFLILRVLPVAFPAACRAAPRSVQRRKQLTQMRCLLQNARTIPPGFLPLLFIDRAHHS
jgi:hypothetical protein